MLASLDVEPKVALRREGTENSYAIAAEAGTPSSGRLRRERSNNSPQHISYTYGLRLIIIDDGLVLSAKVPVSDRPNRRRTNPTKNWVFFPMVGRNGVADGDCQSS